MICEIINFNVVIKTELDEEAMCELKDDFDSIQSVEVDLNFKEVI